MKGIFSACFFTLCSVFAMAQNGTIQGRIVDEKGEGLIQAAVIIDLSKPGMSGVSDYDGNYELSVPPGTYTVTFRYVGKEEQKLNVTVAAGQKAIHNITMTERQKIMDQVVVTGSKYEKKLSEETVSLEVMKGNVLQNQNITDVSNGVQKIPGVTIADGQANIRGGSGWSYGAGSRVAVLYDDLPITTADADDAKWSAIPVENVEQIEVLKGAASSIYGSGALNGVINARMAYPTDEPFTRVVSYAGAYEPPTKTPEMRWWQKGQPQYFAGLSFADRRKLGQVDLITGLAVNTDRGWLDSADAHDARLNVKVRWRVKQVKGLNLGINALGYYSWGKTFFVWDSVGSKAYRPLGGTITQYRNGRYVVDPFVNYQFGDNKLSFRYRWLNSSNINTTGQGSIGNRHILDLSYQRPFTISEKVKLNFVCGVGARIDHVNPPKPENDTVPASVRKHFEDSLGYYPTPYLYGDKPHNAYNTSVYAQLDGKFFNRLNVTLGARYEYFNVDGKNSLKDLKYPLFRVGVNYQAAEATFLRGSFAQGFRYPSIAEFFVTTSLGPISIYPNVNLKPEKGYSAELGIKQAFQFGKKSKTQMFVDLSGFWNQYTNMMEFMFGAFGNPATRPTFGAGFSSQNIGDARILGIDFTLGGQLTAGQFTLNFLAGYTWINTKALNWDKPMTIYNELGKQIKPTDGFGLLTSTYNNANAPKNIDTLNQITYGMTSSATKNTLKYRPEHQLKLVVGLDHKWFDVNIDYQFISFQKNIDNAFVSQTFRAISSAFEGLYQYRDAQIKNNYAGDHILNLAVGVKPTPKFKISFVCKNALNWEWMPRPGRFEAPRNYTLQLAYRF
ncbi:MAG: TonB-dependent receptor [Chitinophagales bacterium]